MTTWTRRSFLTGGSAALAGAMLVGRQGHASSPNAVANARALFADRLPLGAPELKALAARALDAAREGGAIYADVQFRVRQGERWNVTSEDWNSKGFFSPIVDIRGGIGVRVLYNGYWGFAGNTGIATEDGMAALGRNAVAQARMAATGQPREAILAARPIVTDGHWATPVEIDPFTVSDAEKIDFMIAMRDDIQHARFESMVVEEMRAGFMKEERTMAAMDGTFISQTQYVSDGSYGVRVNRHLITKNGGRRLDPYFGPVGKGWEAFTRYPYHDRLHELREDALRMRVTEPMNVGRYDVVFDAASVANMIQGTLAPATEADRAMGYLANGAGTSFLADPLAMLGAYQVASPLVTLTATRSLKDGCASVGWDDEGVVPVDTVLVKNGIVNDLQTTREAASWFAPYYARRGLPVRSNGCAGAGAATDPLAQISPNFVVAPGEQDADFMDLVRTMKTGVAIVGGTIRSDYQGLTGIGRGVLCYDVKDGVLGTVLSRGAWNFRAPEFWKNVVGIGGPRSTRAFGFGSGRGGGAFTVAAVPMSVRNVAFVTQGRGA